MRDNPKIAERLDIDEAARNNPSLAYFVEKLMILKISIYIRDG